MSTTISTISRYLENHEEGRRTEGTAVVTQLLPGNKPIVRIAQTWFHHQGGGQADDFGTIGKSRVYCVVYNRTASTVDHYVDTLEGLSIGSEYPFTIDSERRRLATLYHSAGHLVIHVVQKLSHLPLRLEHHRPSEAQMEFLDENSVLDSRDVVSQLNQQLADAIALDLPVRIVGDPFIDRAIQIGDYEPLRCGGTHVGLLSELQTVEITRIHKPFACPRVRYTVK